MHSHESWSLSPEELEIWDRLYRIKESDGIKEPVLPQAQFETIENLEETPVSAMECFLWHGAWRMLEITELTLGLEEVCDKNAFLRFTRGFLRLGI